MQKSARLMHTVHIVALGLWLGSLVMAGLTAAVIFPLSKELDLRIPASAGYTGEHWALAAGMIQSRVFTYADIIQFAGCILAIATLGHALFRGYAPGRASSIVRVVALLLLLLSLTAQFFFMRPPMDLAMVSYWNAARTGDNAMAAEKRALFQKFHGPASAFMTFDAAAVLVALSAGAWAGIAAERGRPA